MDKTTKITVLTPHILASAIALGISAQAQAFTFELGEIKGQFDTSLSIGASWAVRGPDPDFVSPANGTGLRGESSTRSADDNRQNFKKGETFSKIFKGLHDLELKYGDSGVFVRGKYWYDFELKDEHRLFYDIDDSGRNPLAKSSGAEFLDAFVYHNYQIANLPGSVRLGKQVVSWGESTFIGNSINSINPTDVAALRRPGAEVKEALIPVNMFYISQGLTDNLSAEAFYQIEWESSVVDNCGTFFAADPVAKGCNDRLVSAGKDLPPGVSNNTLTPGNNVFIPRLGDNEPRDGGQFGVALRWFLPELDDTEVAAYYENYHARNPSISLVQSTATPATDQTTRYFIDYPEDIHLYGVSFSTNVGGVSLGGELSYRPNMPLNINSGDVLLAGRRLPFSPVVIAGETALAPGAEVQGYKRMPVYQAQMTATQFIDQVLGASRLTLIGEVGYNHIQNLGSADGTDVRFGRSSIFGLGQVTGAGAAACANVAANPQQQCNDKGFYTADSWGYRARASLSYPNVIAGINLTPNVAWSHDVDGFGPNFEEGLKAASLGLDADFQNTYTASLSYTNFFGGDFNTNTDRDFVALSFGVNF